MEKGRGYLRCASCNEDIRNIYVDMHLDWHDLTKEER